MGQKKPKKEKKQKDEDLSVLERGRPFEHPLFWFALLFLPIVLSIVFSLFRGEEAPVAEGPSSAVERKSADPAAEDMPDRRGGYYGDMPGRGRR